MEDSIYLFLKAGLPDPDKAAKFLQVDRSTISRWRTGKVKMPFAVAQLLHVMAGNPPAGAKQQWFKGWRFNGDLFISPEGEKYTEGDIRSLRLVQAEILGLKAELRKQIKRNQELTEKLDGLQKPETLPDNVVRFPGRRDVG